MLPAREARGAGGPVYYLAGGPGQSARALLPVQRILLREINRRHDLIFLDQRGTGESNPLDCDFSHLETHAEIDDDRLAAAYASCASAMDVDVRYFRTVDAARDLEALRKHLGHERINLIGTSYGTRLAQVYVRQQPDRVRSMVLDGIVPMTLALGSEHAPMLDRTLTQLVARCAAEQACAERYPELEQQLEQLRTHLRATDGIQVTPAHPRTGEPVPFTLTHDGLAQTIRMLSYSAHTQALLPLLLDEALSSDRFDRLAGLLLMIHDQLDDLISLGLEASVSCSEDWPLWSRQLPADDDTLLGDRMRLQRAAICAVWPALPPDPDFHTPVDARIPTLLLSGEFDPVTPPAYGEALLDHFSPSLHLVVPGQGHNVLSPPCVSSIAADFLRNPEPAQLDTQCLPDQGGEPFFRSLLGPTP